MIGRNAPPMAKASAKHYGAARFCESGSEVPMQQVQVLNIQRLSAVDRAKIEAVDPAVRLTEAGGWFDGEYRETWPAYTAVRYLAPGAAGTGTREERDRLLAQAEIILGGWPFPLDLRARAPQLKWFHQRPAGASNLLRGDLWGSDVTVTTSRGLGSTLAMAEYVVASILYFAKSLHRTPIDRVERSFNHRAYRSLLIEGKTACVVGAGGIGRDVGRLCAALGLRVVGTRRRPAPSEPMPSGFTEIGGPGDLDRYLPESDFVAVCCQWTPETHRLFDKRPLRRDEAGECAGQCRPRRDRRRGRPRRRARRRPSARRRPRCLCRRIRAPTAREAVVQSQCADHPACLRGQRRGPPWCHRSLLRQPPRLSRRQAVAQCDRLGTGILVGDFHDTGTAAECVHL